MYSVSLYLSRDPFTSHIVVHLERMGSFPEEVVRFYVAELGSALAFLHEKKIIHRFVLTCHVCARGRN